MQDHPRLSEALSEYLAMRSARYSAPTVTNETFVLKRFLAWLGEDLQVRNLRPERVEAWFYGDQGLRHSHVTRDGRARDAIRENTHNFYRSRLKSFFDFCTQRGWLRVDPLSGVRPLTVPTTRRAQPAPRVLLAMLDAAWNPRDRCWIATAINTGLRASEIARIRVSDVHLDRGDLTVWISKSKEADDLPISLDLDREFRLWLETYAADLERPLTGQEYLFPAMKGSHYKWTTMPDGTKVKGRSSSTWNPDKHVVKTERIVQQAMADLGLPTKHEGTHTLRRAVARAFFDAQRTDLGYDAALRTTSALLHHKSSSTTEHYLGLSSERERRDLVLRGRPFLTGLVDDSNVTPLRVPRSG